MSHSLNLYSHPLQSTTGKAFTGDLTVLAHRYRRRIKAVGGYWSGEFALTQDDLTRAELQSFYSQFIGCRLVETTYGMVSFEAEIQEMRLFSDGVESMQSLKQSYFRNKIKVLYSDTVNSRVEIAWSENADSSDIFGESCYIHTMGGATSVGATALRDRDLAEYAWPRSRIVGGDAREFDDAKTRPDELRVILAGYWHTLNRRYRESSTTAGASTLLTTLVGESEFVSVKRIETNADSVRVDCVPIPRRSGDLFKDIIEQGDNAGNVWQGGVYDGRGFVYEEAPTDWTYQLVDEELLNQAGNPVPLSLVEAGFLLYNPSAPTGWARPGTSSGWDDPALRYVDEVDFVAGEKIDQLRLHYYGAVEGISATLRRVRRGNL